MEHIADVDNDWKALVVVAALLIPQIFAWLNSRQAKHATRRAQAIMEHEANPNSGGSMKDSLNRTESALGKHGESLDDLNTRMIAVEEKANRSQ